MSDAAIALNRFGLGARRGEAAPDAPKAWLLNQFDRYEARPAAIAAVPTRASVAGELAAFLDERRDMAVAARREQRGASRQEIEDGGAPMMADVATEGAKDDAQGARRDARQGARADYLAMTQARVATALDAPAPFVERLVHFWANHFAVSVDKFNVIGLGGLLEFEAIRPHVLGRFGDMLNAVESHPAMLLYLDQAQSIGPDSPVGARVGQRDKRLSGLNENLAREILELHTLGVRTVYDQNDVTEFARALTGRTVAGLVRGPLESEPSFAGAAPGRVLFVASVHEPGARQIMGKTYAEGGETQAQAVLADLAVHPATARHIATKLSRHFAGDDPPAPLVARLERAFLASGGDLPTVYRALIDAPEVWGAAPVRFKTPWDWYLSALRAMGTRDAEGRLTVGLMMQLGQPVWRPGSPAGYDDIDASWIGPDALTRRVSAAERLAARAGRTVDARTIAPQLLPGMLRPATATALAQAEGPAEALALLLVSPEFLRR